MTAYKICVVGGWCGNRMVMVAEYLAEVLSQSGYTCQVRHHSIWENFSAPPRSHLVLQLLPAFTEADTGCPVISIRPLLRDLNHPETLAAILGRIRTDYPAVTGRRVPAAGLEAVA